LYLDYGENSQNSTCKKQLTQFKNEQKYAQTFQQYISHLVSSCPFQHLVISNFKKFFYFFVHGVQCLDVGSQFPDQGLNPGHSGENAKSTDPQGNSHKFFFFLPL